MLRGILLLGLVLAVTGCLQAPTTTPSPAPAQTRCHTFDAQAVPNPAPAGSPVKLRAVFANCGSTTLNLSHACLRALDVRLLEMYNSTTPGVAAPPGVGPKESWIVDGPVANLTMPCATAPPFVREVAAHQNKTVEVAWSGKVARDGCGDASCALPLAPGRYMLAANALDADTGAAYIATSWLTLT